MRKQNTILWALKQNKKRLPQIILLISTQIVRALLGVVFALGTKGVIDAAISGVSAEFTKACFIQAALVLGIVITSVIDRHVHDMLIAYLDWDWKKRIMHGLLHGDFAAVSKYHSGELLNRLNNDVRILNTNLLAVMSTVASMSTKLIAALFVLVTIEPLLTVVITVSGVVVILMTGFVRRKMQSLHKQVSTQDGKVSGFLQETLEKLLMVQAMDVPNEIEKRADNLMLNRFKLQRKRKNVSLIANTGVNIMGMGIGFVALVWGASGIIAGTMTYGTLTALTQLVAQIRSPLVGMSGIIPQYTAIGSAAERLMELEELCGEPEPTENMDAVYAQMTHLGADDLCFGYDRDRIFDHASFTVPKGSFGVIVGHSGIGKSTLLKLMLGVFRQESGQLYVRTEGREIPLGRKTRRLFAYVPQGNLLLSGTLRENLIITRPDATEEEICEAIRISGMDDYLSGLPQGLETVVGENAAGLSEGQAQRLSIARAIVSKAPILLLDEATSALDSATENEVLQRLKAMGKTCIAVTHRPAAIELSDWSLELQNGKCILKEKM